MVRVKGPASELEAAAHKKLVSEKEIKKAILEGDKKLLDKTKNQTRELLSFYERVIRSINTTILQVSNKKNLTLQQKKKYINNQEKELTQAKREKSKFRRYLNQLNSCLQKNK